MARLTARLSASSWLAGIAVQRAHVELESDTTLKAGHEEVDHPFFACVRDSCMHICVYAETKINTLIVFG